MKWSRIRAAAALAAGYAGCVIECLRVLGARPISRILILTDSGRLWLGAGRIATTNAEATTKALEQYTMGALPTTALRKLELHPPVCHRCQDRMTEMTH